MGIYILIVKNFFNFFKNFLKKYLTRFKKYAIM
nr:MAG TPA: hypothetical protein [Bacteriophage sp.]